MPRKTKRNSITSKELLQQVNPDNTRLKKDFLLYLKSVQRSPQTIYCYENDLDIFFVWNATNNGNKPFAKITKRDLVSYQNWLINENGNSPARVRRLKATISSLSNYIENICDDDPEFEGFKSIVKKIENPVNQPVREHTVLSEEQIDALLYRLVQEKKYEKACMLALAACSGRRKSELVRFKVHYFDEKNIIYGSLYKTPEPVKTKGRGNGKYIYCYTLSKKFKPYFDMWMAERSRLGIESEWLFPLSSNMSEHMNANTINSWMLSFSKMLGVDIYTHAFRHYYTTYLSKSGLPDSVIQSIIGWSTADMVSLYKDTTVDEEIEQYFDDGNIRPAEKKSVSDL